MSIFFHTLDLINKEIVMPVLQGRTVSEAGNVAAFSVLFYFFYGILFIFMAVFVEETKFQSLFFKT